MNRSEKLWKIRQTCIKANPDLWNDHGDILKRRIAHGAAVPTKLGLADVLLACKAANDADEDAMNVARELMSQIISKWDVRKDDINEQADSTIGLLADLIL